MYNSTKTNNSNIMDNYDMNNKNDIIDIGDYKNSKFAKELINQLLKIPTIKYFEHRTEILLFRSLYFALSDHHKYYDYIFPKEFRLISYPNNWDDVNESTFNKLFYLDQIKKKSKGHNNHICAAAIPNGKLVYNCYDCGVDPTCCLCEDCFNKEEHSDHNVSVHKSSGDAICDCGDENSWNVKLNCKANKLEENLRKNLQPLPINLKKNISIMIRILLDFILNINLTNLSPLSSNLNLNLKGKEKFNSINNFLNNLSNINTLPNPFNDIINEMYKNDYLSDNDEVSSDIIETGNLLDYYCLVIWNDEFHNFDEANRFLNVAYKFSSDYDDDDFPFYELNYKSYSDFDINENGVTQLAKIIDEKGFVMYSRSKDKSILEEQIEKFKSYENLGNSKLTYTLIPAKDYINISLSRSILVWFDVILENENILLTDYIKKELTNAMFERQNFNLNSIPLFDYLENKHFLLNKDLKIPIYLEKNNSINNSSVNINSFKINLIFPDIEINYIENATRLHYLTFFEMRFPKSMRKLIKKLIIPIISNTKETRLEFSKQILTILPTFEYNVANYDREWHLSLLETFRLQVYHDPNLGTELIKLGFLNNIIDSILNIFINSTCLFNGKFYVTHNSWKERRTLKVLSQTIEGLNVILKFIHDGIDEFFKDNYIVKILRLVCAFDETHKLIRKSDIHEEFQDQSTCVAYYNSVIPIYSIAQSLARIIYGINSKNENVEKSIILISSYLKSSKKRKIDCINNTINFNITTDGVSMAHPVGNLLAELSRSYKYYSPNLLLNSVSSITYDSNTIASFEVDNNNFNINNNYKHFGSFIPVADEMLQPWILHGQISCNFWIRNGIDAAFANSVFDMYKPENNLFIIQQGIILDNLPLKDIIDRYMLTECFYGDLNFENTIFEEKIPMILHEFVTLMYYILTFRQYYDSNLSYDDYYNLVNEYIIASLIAPSPIKYSKLESEAPNCSTFENIVEKITKYIPPADYNSYGQYTLKDEYWSKIDPFNCFHGINSSSEIEEAVIKNLANVKNKNENDIVLVPQLYKLEGEDLNKFKKVGEFMKTKDFVKILYKILRFAVTSDIDSHLNIVLQLIHAIIIDDELFNKDNSHGLKYFVEIPICNLLMSAAEKTDIPKYVSKKASAILELLLLKDDDVLTSLMDCFGESHIEKYKKSKQGKTLETKIERKRRLALKRQKKILSKMKKQQTAFIDNNKTFFENNNNTEKSNMNLDKESSTTPIFEKIEKESRSCILCKNPETSDSGFGIPVFVSTSSIYWTIPTIDDCPPEFMVKDLPRIDKEKCNKAGKSSCTREKLVAYGCPHGMHYECFFNMLEKKNIGISNFTCPLCKGRFNLFIPSFKPGEIEVDAKSFEKIKYNISKFHESFNGGNLEILKKQLMDDSLLSIISYMPSADYKLLLNRISRLTRTSNYLTKCLPPYKVLLASYYRNMRKEYYTQFSMSLLIASTLEMHEIASRKEDTIVIPEILNLVMKSLLQYRILFRVGKDVIRGETKKYFEFLLHNPYIGFIETTIVLFIETNIPLKTCIKFSLMKRIIYTGLSLLQREKVNKHNLSFDSILDDNIEPLSVNSIIYQSLSNVLEEIISHNKGKKYSINSELIQKLYKILKTNYKNFERQVKFISLFFNTLPLPSGESLLPNLDDFITNILKVDRNENDFKNIILDGIAMTLHEKTFAKCHKRDEAIDIIEYPKNVHLMELPEKLKDIALFGLNKTEKFLYEDDFDGMRVGQVKCSNVCLNCGQWVNKLSEHMKECKLSGYATLFFTPMKNNLYLYVNRMVTMKNFKIESPYLNKHGEPSQGLVGSGDAGTLDLNRYEHLEKIWFDQSIIMKFIRDGTSLFQILPMASGVTSDVHIPGIFEPIVEAGGPSISEVERFNRLLGFPDMIFENTTDIRNDGNIVYDENGSEEYDDVFTGDLIEGLRALRERGGEIVGREDGVIIRGPGFIDSEDEHEDEAEGLEVDGSDMDIDYEDDEDGRRGREEEEEDDDDDDEDENHTDHIWTSRNFNSDDDNDNQNDSDYLPENNIFQFLPRFGENGPYTVDGNDNFYENEEEDDDDDDDDDDNHNIYWDFGDNDEADDDYTYDYNDNDNDNDSEGDEDDREW